MLLLIFQMYLKHTGEYVNNADDVNAASARSHASSINRALTRASFVPEGSYNVGASENMRYNRIVALNNMLKWQFEKVFYHNYSY